MPFEARLISPVVKKNKVRTKKINLLAVFAAELSFSFCNDLRISKPTAAELVVCCCFGHKEKLHEIKLNELTPHGKLFNWIIRTKIVRLLTLLFLCEFYQ